jgi:TolB-like protein/Flp pilus assembly protein TadD
VRPGGGGRPGAVPLTPERWRVVTEVLGAALERTPAERPAVVAAACGADAALRSEVEALLAVAERAESSLGVPTAWRAEAVRADGSLPTPAAAVARNAPEPARLAAALEGRYVVERELGRGGMATVYLARDLRHDRVVAVKVLERNVPHGGAERFLHEIRTAARLTHPHVLGVHDSGEVDGLLYYVMPYVEGETLRARLAREGALPLADVVRLVRELADALSYAHGRGVMHRDLKPENVLISGGHAVVADFGIAKALAAATQDGTTPGAGLTSAGMALGTPAYMAPEQAVGDAGTDHRADLYALGVIAYEALAGGHPFGARTPQSLVAAHLTEPPAPVDARRTDAPPALAALVMRLLAKDPSARPQTAAAVLRALDDAWSPPSVPASIAPGAFAAPPTGTSSGRRWMALAVVATLLVALGIGGYALWRRITADQRQMVGTRGGTGTEAGGTVIRTVAVLPFENTGGAAADDYFSHGMTDELSHALARLPGLRLAGRTSSYTFKGKAAAAQEIGRVLGVGAYVSGTVRRGGDRLRVTTQLVGTADGRVLWDSVFESGSGDVFAVQDALTRAIVAALAPALGDRAARGSEDPAADVARGTTDQVAYDLYQKGRYNFLLRNPTRLARAVAYYRQAVTRDPTFARAYAGLSLAYGVWPVYFPGSADSVRALAKASAERAVALDSTLADARFALARALEEQLRFREGLAHYRAGLAFDPSSVTGHHWFGSALLNLGEIDEALVELRLATQLDPLAHSAAGSVALALLAARRFPEAAAAARHSLSIDSTFWGSKHVLGIAQAFGGQPDSAMQTLERGVREHPHHPRLASGLVFAYAAAGRWTDAARVREQLHRAGGDVSPGGVEAAFADLVFGDREPLVRLLTSEAGQVHRLASGWLFGCNPLVDPLWADARFRAAMRALTVETCTRARPWPIPARPGA